MMFHWMGCLESSLQGTERYQLLRKGTWVPQNGMNGAVDWGNPGMQQKIIEEVIDHCGLAVAGWKILMLCCDSGQASRDGSCDTEESLRKGGPALRTSDRS